MGQSQYATMNKNLYNSLKYDRISLVLKKTPYGVKEAMNKEGIQKLAAEHGMSVNAFIQYCINTVAGKEICEPLDNYSRRPMQIARTTK